MVRQGTDRDVHAISAHCTMYKLFTCRHKLLTCTRHLHVNLGDYFLADFKKSIGSYQTYRIKANLADYSTKRNTHVIADHTQPSGSDPALRIRSVLAAPIPVIGFCPL